MLSKWIQRRSLSVDWCLRVQVEDDEGRTTCPNHQDSDAYVQGVWRTASEEERVIRVQRAVKPPETVQEIAARACLQSHLGSMISFISDDLEASGHGIDWSPVNIPSTHGPPSAGGDSQNNFPISMESPTLSSEPEESPTVSRKAEIASILKPVHSTIEGSSEALGPAAVHIDLPS